MGQCAVAVEKFHHRFRADAAWKTLSSFSPEGITGDRDRRFW
jgi:hypothetical protein